MAKARDTATDSGFGTPGPGEEVAPTGQRKVPREMRTLYKEIARLSGYLGIARSACYANNPGKAVRALALIESALFAAKEVAELLGDVQEADAG